MSRCFILGAGFSKCCGLPLASELTPIIWRSRAKRDPMANIANPPLSGPGDFGYESVLADLKAVRMLFPGHACDPHREDGWPDFEELITALDEASRYQGSFERIKGTITRNWAQDAKSHFMHHLEERLHELTESAPPTGLNTIQRFLTQLDLESDVVISFNWDMLLEIASVDLEIQIDYHGDRGPALQVAKPHGSLNLVDSTRKDYEEARTAINVFDLEEEFEYANSNPHVILRARDPRRAGVRQAWATARLLVEPNIRKSYDNTWLELQWVRALDMIRSASELIVIGFSLPIADLRPRILFQLAGLHRAETMHLVLVDPSANSLVPHYHRLTGLEASPFDGTLEDWIMAAR